jgi:hypothetical protein
VRVITDRPSSCMRRPFRLYPRRTERARRRSSVCTRHGPRSSSAGRITRERSRSRSSP